MNPGDGRRFLNQVPPPSLSDYCRGACLGSFFVVCADRDEYCSMYEEATMKDSPPSTLSNVRLKVWAVSVLALGAWLMIVAPVAQSIYAFGLFFLAIILALLIRCEGCGQFWAQNEDNDNNFKMVFQLAKECPRCGIPRR